MKIELSEYDISCIVSSLAENRVKWYNIALSSKYDDLREIATGIAQSCVNVTSKIEAQMEARKNK